MNPYQEVLQQLIRDLTNLHGMGFAPLAGRIPYGTPNERRDAINEILRYIKELGYLIRNYQKELMSAHQKARVASTKEELVNFADYLDNNGLYALADQITDVVALVKEAEIIPIEEAKKKKDIEQKKNFIEELAEKYSGEDYMFALNLFNIADSLENYAHYLKRSDTPKEHRGVIFEALDNIVEVLRHNANIIKDVKKFSSSISDLTKLANWLDENNFYALADKVDKSLGLVKIAEDYGYCPQVGKMEEDKSPLQYPHESSLSTRYCPDHVGVQTIRIDDRIVQCPLDGKEYNYETGYLNYEGQRVLGGSVAAQTPVESNYGGIPMRFYDSRSDVLFRLT